MAFNSNPLAGYGSGEEVDRAPGDIWEQLNFNSKDGEWTIQVYDQDAGRQKIKLDQPFYMVADFDQITFGWAHFPGSRNNPLPPILVHSRIPEGWGPRPDSRKWNMSSQCNVMLIDGPDAKTTYNGEARRLMIPSLYNAKVMADLVEEWSTSTHNAPGKLPVIKLEGVEKNKSDNYSFIGKIAGAVDRPDCLELFDWPEPGEAGSGKTSEQAFSGPPTTGGPAPAPVPQAPAAAGTVSDEIPFG